MVAAIAALAHPDVSRADDAARDRALAKTADGYIIELTITREGQGGDVSKFRVDGSSYRSDWRLSPTRVRAHVATRVDQGDQWIDTGTMYWLELWDQSVDQELARVQQARQFEQHPMRAFADEDERVLRAAAARAEDVRVLLRLLHGIQYYEYVDNNAGNPAQPVSAAPEISFDGGESVIHSRNQFGHERTEAKEVPAWGPEEAPAGLVVAAKSISLLVWRFDPADMARARELVAEAGQIAGDMTYRSANVDADLIDPNMNYGWENQAQYLHEWFRDAFLAALRNVTRYAWTLAPKKPPPGLFAEGPEAQWWFGDLAPEAPLSLPEIAGDRLIRLVMPAAGVDEEHLRVMGGQWKGGSRTEYDWFYYFWGSGPRPSEKVSLQVSESAGTEHHFFFNHPWVTSQIDGDFSGEHNEGQISHTAEYQEVEEVPGSDGAMNHRNIYDLRDQVRVLWSITYVPGPASPEDEPMTLSFARPVDGKPVPFDGSIDYGEAFYVEGRMREPATREVYRVLLETPDGTPRDVFLRPTEDDPTLLRSELLYVMWDVSKQEGAP